MKIDLCIVWKLMYSMYIYKTCLLISIISLPWYHFARVFIFLGTFLLPGKRSEHNTCAHATHIYMYTVLDGCATMFADMCLLLCIFLCLICILQLTGSIPGSVPIEWTHVECQCYLQIVCQIKTSMPFKIPYKHTRCLLQAEWFYH